MKNGWQLIKLGELCELNYGKALVAKARNFGNVPVYSSAGVIGVHNVPICETEGIIIGRKGSVGTVYYSPVPFFCIDTAFYIKPSEKYDLRFLYYLLTTLNLNKLNSDSAVPGLNRYNAYSQIFYLPPIFKQKEISIFLSELDNKIELNEKINQNLEAQAQAIFKSWFVDFEPFGGKMPADWNIAELRAVCKTITKGTTPTTLKKAFVDKGVNFIKAESILSNHTIDLSKIMFIDDETNELLSRSQIKPFDILYTIAGTIGRFSMVMPTQIPANTNQAVAIIRCIDEYKFFIYNMFLCGCHTKYLTTKVVQAVQANLSLAAIGSLPIIQPSQNALEKYLKLITPIFGAIFKNNEESCRLAQLRDTLLPKLMSGEIDVSDVAV